LSKPTPGSRCRPGRMNCGDPVKPNEKRPDEILEAIHNILLHDWDPIGIGSEPEAQDEYDMYVGQLHRLLISGASEEQLVDSLETIVTERMCLNSDRQRARTVARKLIALI